MNIRTECILGGALKTDPTTVSTFTKIHKEKPLTNYLLHIRGLGIQIKLNQMQTSVHHILSVAF